MVARKTGRVALMAIQPRFAQAILAGTKTIEFRKRNLAPDVRTVLIYQTSPTRRIVGEFDLSGNVVASPSHLWRQFSEVAGIDAESFDAYFAGRNQAVGLTISSVRSYDRGVALCELVSGPSVPQSFIYLDDEQAQQIRARSTSSSGVDAELQASP
jgi:predicted transcriptional regulator